jgi:hypothetical protein
MDEVKRPYYCDVIYELSILLPCANPDALRFGAWNFDKHLIPDRLVELIANNPGLEYSKSMPYFIAYFDDEMVDICKAEIAERVILGED